MDYDEDKVDAMVLALMYLTIHDQLRAWKGCDFHALDRLHANGFIEDPRNKAPSVVFTEKGLAHAKARFETHVGTPSS